jgi:hypothetical protein
MDHLDEFKTSAASPARSNEFRVAAVAGVVGAVCYAAASIVFPKISDALNPTSIDHGLAELAAHSTLAMVCQQLFAVADIAMIVFLFGLAALAKPPVRSIAWLGSFLFSISFALDLLVVGLVVAATMFIAPHAARDPALHAAGTATLGFASVLDFREGFLWVAGSILLGGTAWRGQYWPRWLAGAAILNGILAAPYLPFFVASVIGNIVFIIWVLGMSVILWRQKARY